MPRDFDWCRLTDFVILGSTVALILYDITACLMGGGQASISARIQFWSPRFLIIPVAVGLLVAHLFWPVFGVRD